ncbi:alpha/beta hydrolase [Kineosporia mesophila]|uniref:Alpha/beta hydrolase n=1 Tax=Kineosporia mesophila TaxID=566012 RepID=A0ABP7ADU0_9ACTN
MRIPVNGIEINVTVEGSGEPVVLLHGWPHTWRVWSEVIPELAGRHQVLAPDLRGLGDSDRPAGGYDLNTLADDVLSLLDAHGLRTAHLVGIDLGAPIAFFTALRDPGRVSRLVLTEGLIGTLPGAENFAPPWWFGFHRVPGLAETVLPGHEAEYLNWFYRSGTLGRGLPAHIEDAFVRAYSGTEGLRGGFEHYRAMPGNASLIADLASKRRLTVPTAVIGGATVGEATANQVRPLADDLQAFRIPDGGHILPLDRPRELLEIMVPFLGRA